MLENYGLWRVFGVFCRHPTTELSVADIGREANLTYPAVLRHLEVLEREEIITRKLLKKGSRDFPVYKVWFDSNEYIYYKQLYNIISIRELVAYIMNSCGPKCIILFGSYRHGYDIEKSDIDLFIQRQEFSLDVKPFEKKLNREINLLWHKDFTEMPQTLQQNMLNGYIMQGTLEVHVDQKRTRLEKSTSPKRIRKKHSSSNYKNS